MRFSLIRRRVQDLLENSGIRKVPVSVEKIVKTTGAVIKYENHDGEISGLLFRKNGNIVIGINSMHPENRRRFSIAHELGHLILHKEENFHLDQNSPIRFKDTNSIANDEIELEANRFAMELLMPVVFLNRDIVDYTNIFIDDAIKVLARKYKVSAEVMTMNLILLGYIQGIKER